MSELNLTHSNGNKVKLTTPDTLATNKTFKLPGADGSSGQFLKTDGSGALSFATALTPQSPTYTEYSTQTVGGTNSYAITITGDPKVFEVSLFEIRHGNAANIMYRLSKSGSETSSAYFDIGFYHQAGSGDTCTRGYNQGQGCLVNYDFNGADNLMTGKAIFTKVNTGLYTFSAIYNMHYHSDNGSNGQYILTSSGHVNNTSAVTQFRMFTSNGANFTSGTINVRGIV